MTEMESLRKNKTWDLVPLPVGRAPIACRWVFNIKPATITQPKRFKARLVAKGFSQLEGVDYFQTFAPVARTQTIRVLLATAASRGWFMFQADVVIWKRKSI